MDAVYTIWLRNMKRYLRSKSRIFGSLGQPLFFLLLLGYGLSSFSIPGLGQNYQVFIVPGIIAMTVMFTSIFSGIQIIWDKQFGFLKETLIAPVSRNAIMLGQTLGGATTAILQGLLIFFLSILIVGFRPTLPGIAICIGFMALIGISLTAFGIAIASKMDDMQGFQLIMNFVLFPIFFSSGAVFPIDNAPEILKVIAHLNPLTYGVEGIRYGLFGASQINPILCFAVLAGFSAAMVMAGGLLFRKVKV
ncbi:MAG: ABC transporter permease [Candidatus Aenigmarchaeota archaeon]|nr:ABC transporter permease [Candidatus Aenigmarchaeota archaeon]